MIKLQKLFVWGVALQLAAVLSVTHTCAAKNEKWEPAIQKFEASDAVTSPPKHGILFIGSSSIVGWKLDQFFPGLPVINRGFGGSQTSDILDYYDRVVKPYDPKLVVFYSGENDLTNKKTPAQVSADVKQLMQKIHGDFPQAKVIIIPPKPSLDRWHLWKELQELAELQKEFAESTDYITIVDPRDKMLGTDGKPRPEIFKSDKLHMNDDGYVIWSDLLRPMLEDYRTTVPQNDLGTSRTAAVITPVAPNVWMHRSWFRFPNGDTYFSNGLIVKNGAANTAVLVDTPWGEESTTRLLANIKDELKLDVRAAVVTHWHSDKTAGVDILKARGIPVYAKPETIALCKKNGKPVPDHAIDGLSKPGDMVSLEGVEVMYPGEAHASDNVVVWEPGTNVLLGGCAVKAAADNHPGNLSDANLKEWPAAMERVEAMYGNRSEIVIPAHGEPGGGELLKHTAKIAERFSRTERERAVGN